MSVNENKRLIRRYVDEVINTGNVGIIEQFISPDYVEVHEGKRYEIGVAGAKEHVLGVRKTYPDLHLRVHRQIAEGEWVSTIIEAKGTHLGDWMGIKPTRKVLIYTGININRIVGGRIVEHGGAANLLGPLLEAGAIRVVEHD
jgi:predicted ester cyclase